MQRKKFRVRRYIKPVLTAKIKAHNTFLFRTRSIRKSSIKLKEVYRYIHTASGRSLPGKIVVRGKSAPLFNFYSRPLLNKHFARYRLVSLLNNPIQPQSSLGLVLGRHNIMQYYTIPFGSSIGDSFFVCKTHLDYIRLSHFRMHKNVGNTVCLENIPTGSKIYNIEQSPGKGPALCKAPGCFSKLLMKKKMIKGGKLFAGIELPSKKLVYVNLKCFASLGRVSVVKVGVVAKKFGYFRARGIRPKVRGVAMNPIDHPHGGGEGKKPKPRVPKNPWGTQAKFIKTLTKDQLIKRRRFVFKMKRFALNLQK